MITPPCVVPPDKPLSVLGALRTGRHNILETVPAAVYTEPIVSGRTLWRWHSAASPQAMRHVLRDHVSDYPKSRIMRRILDPVIEKSVFVADGDDWSWQRRAFAGAFQPRALAGFTPLILEQTERAINRLSTNGARQIDICPFITSVAFKVISQTIISSAKEADEVEFQHLFTTYLDNLGHISILDFLNLPVRFRRAIDIGNRPIIGKIRRHMNRVVDQRVESGQKRSDFLQTLLDARDPEGRPLSRELLRSNLFAFFFAGHETTALVLSWALYLCARDPNVQDRVRQEARTCLAAPTVDEINAGLGYTQQVIEETLRLYPPAGMIVRNALRDDEICDRHIRRGDYVFLPIYALHRHRDYWERPDEFDPERFAAPRKSARDRFLFLPFGAGPRICLGASLAIQQAKIMLATVLSRVSVATTTVPPPHPQLIITLRPEGGIYLELKPI
jgi:cytochrome P450